jgi:hypothetical protein
VNDWEKQGIGKTNKEFEKETITKKLNKIKKEKDRKDRHKGK